MKSIISLILIIASISFFVFFTKPKWTELKANKLEIEKLNIAKDNAKKLKAKIDSLQKIRNGISEADMKKIERMIPNNVENVKLIIDFDTLLQKLVEKNGTAALYRKNKNDTTEKISIENPSISQGNTTIEGGFDSSQLGVADFRFGVSLTYNDFLDLLKTIESSTRIFEIESISFSAPNNVDTKNTNEIVYNFNIGLKTFWLKSK